MIKNKLIAVLAVLLAGTFFGVANVSADLDDMDSVMTISPPKQKIVLVPGETFEGVIRVSNSAHAKGDLHYSASIGSFGLGKDEEGNIDYNDTDVDTVTSYNQMMNWITLGKESGTVEPNGTDVVPFTISVPSDAPAGGQYATIIFQDDSGNGTTGDGNVSIESVVRFASSIIAEVAGETRDEGAILENSIPSFIFNNKLSATSTVRNDGNVHTDASYVLQVWPLFGDEEIECIDKTKPVSDKVEMTLPGTDEKVMASTSLIMPETERYHVEECNLPMIGIFRAKQTVNIFGETSVAEKTVFVCPLWLLFIIVFAIVLIIIWLVMRAKSGSKRD